MCSYCTVRYAVDMTTKGTPGRMVRIDDETWAEYAELCKAEGTSRADDMRRHVHARVNGWRRAKKQRHADLIGRMSGEKPANPSP